MAEEQQVPAVQGEGAGLPQHQRPVPRGLEDADSDDFVISRMIIVHQLSDIFEKVQQVGVYVDPDTLETCKHFDFVPITMFKTRRYPTRDERGKPVKGAPVICFSKDAKHPVVPLHIGDGSIISNCIRCPHAYAGTDKTPNCDLQYNYAILVTSKDDVELDHPAEYFLRLQRGSLFPARSFNNVMKKRAVDIWHGVYRATIEKVPTVDGQNKYDRPRFVFKEPASDKLIQWGEAANGLFASAKEKLREMSAADEDGSSFDFGANKEAPEAQL